VLGIFRKLPLLAIGIGLLLGSLRAADQPVIFAVPDSGKVTLGVFDNAGRLVRLLHRLAPETDFKVGLNGLMTTWDGRNDKGEPMPPGHYHIRGYLIGDVAVRSEGFHFNDWISSHEVPQIRRILDFAMCSPTDILLVAEVANSARIVARYSPERGFVWKNDLDPAVSVSPLVAEGFITQGSGLVAFDPETGESRESPIPKSGGEIEALAVSETQISLASGRKLSVYRRPSGEIESESETPMALTELTSDTDALAGIENGGIFLRRDSKDFEKLDVPVRAASLAFGSAGTLWFVSADEGEAFVGQLSPAGELLRALRMEAGGLPPRTVRTWKPSEIFAVLDESPTAQRLRVMSRSAEGDWEIEWERSLKDVSSFGMAEGQLAPAGDIALPKELEFRLKENPLSGHTHTLRLHAVSDGAGTRLETPDGLPLVEVSPQKDIARSFMQRGKIADSVTIFSSNNSVVEEFSVTGLRNVLMIDAGGIDLP